MADIIIRGSLQQHAGSKSISFAEAFLSVEAVLIIDISGSMAERDVASESGMIRRWDEAQRQLTRLQARFPGRVSVVAFSDNATFCPDGKLPGIQGGTNMLGALQFISPADGCGIKFIIASDGEPSDPASVLNQAQKMETKLDTIYIGSESRGQRFMKELAAASGGKALDNSVLELEENVVKLLAAKV
jgi:Mg-chelatase subunit ChlD